MALTIPEPYRLDVSDVEGAKLSDLSFARTGLVRFVEHAFDHGHALNNPSDGSFPLSRKLIRAGLDTPEKLLQKMELAFLRAQQLRHASVIEAGHAINWLAGVFNAEADRVDFHVSRLDGVPASSAYTYVAEAEGKRCFFNSARMLDEIRLMRRVPGGSTQHTKRGTFLEELARRLFFDRYQSTFTPDKDGLEKVRQQKGVVDHPWLIGNPDELAFYLKSAQPVRVLVDYKCPNVPKEPEAPAPMEYRVQLQNYAMLATAAEVPVGAMVLCHLHVPEDIANLWVTMLEDDPGNIDDIFKHAQYSLKHKVPGIEMSVKQLSIDHALQTRVIAACSAADARVLRGEVSPHLVKPKLQIEDGQLQEARKIQGQLTRLLALKQSVEEREKVLKGNLGVIFADLDTTKDTGLQHLTIKRNEKLRAANAVEALRAQGVDTRGMVRAVIEETLVFDKELIFDALTENGLVLDEFVDETLAIGFRGVKSGPIFEEIQGIKAKGVQDIDRLMGNVAPKPVAEPAPAEAPKPPPAPKPTAGKKVIPAVTPTPEAKPVLESLPPGQPKPTGKKKTPAEPSPASQQLQMLI